MEWWQWLIMIGSPILFIFLVVLMLIAVAKTGGSSNRSKKSNGMGFTGVLLTIFIVLKLTGTIQWSWFWVMSPMWIASSLGILIILVATMLVLVFKK